ncbi:hypothetical protein ALC60_05809 [Trachymyrmex zeteki]|uniref:Uncharacterized protein n=1 Tax=Mycetomoellerius zeteki TaxID=64791 RepID=A0A151X4H2_9HYME|nr:hypothetical protein ALC60_05809 [Trachymyrmex zeteki]
MGEPKPAVSPQPNGGVKQKPTSLNLAPGPGFYRNVNGRASLNDRHLQHVTALIGGGRTAHVNKSASPNPAVAINNSESGGGGGTPHHHEFISVWRWLSKVVTQSFFLEKFVLI